jgi:N-acetylmuramoyl-L-alanine amidase
VAWLSRNHTVKLVRGSSTLVASIHSRKITINGIAVWLSVPISVRNGIAYIAPIDLTTAVHPILFPSRNPSRQSVRTIVIDPGHGGRDPGNRAGRQQEKQHTLLLAKELSTQLTKAGFRVTLTRTKDAFVELPTRPKLAKARGSDLFLSLHFNSAPGAGGRAVQGSETYAMTPARASSTNARGQGAGSPAYPGNRHDSKNVLLAYLIQKSIVRKLGAVDRGVRRARFSVLRSAEMPAALIEAGFMSHALESKRIYDPTHRRRLAQAIVDGVMAYKKIVESS